jgi:hypothetical protein
MMKRPYADDWEQIPDTPLMYSQKRGLYWHTVEKKEGDEFYANWAGWIGYGARLRKVIAECNAEK